MPVKSGHGEREDYEYERCGVCNIFMAVEPVAGKRLVRVTERKTKMDWAKFLNEIAENYDYAEKITLVMDNLNTHTPGSLYETFKPARAKDIWERFEFVYTPKHGSWLNMENICTRHIHSYYAAFHWVIALFSSLLRQGRQLMRPPENFPVFNRQTI